MVENIMLEVSEKYTGRYVDFKNEYLDDISGIIDEVKYGQYIICWINDEEEEVFEIVHPKNITYVHEEH